MGVIDRVKERKRARYLRKHPEAKIDRTVEIPEDIKARIAALEEREKALDRIESGLESLIKEGKKDKRKEIVKNLTGSVTRVVPKGIKLPDSTVRNKHLYTGGSQGKKARLF